jgi:hypothetical protein
MTRPADIWVITICTALGVGLFAYQEGYDHARAECKPAPSYEIKPMTHKQQVKWAKWANRDKGWIK